MTSGNCVQDLFLEMLQRERAGVAIYLVNGIRLQGVIVSSDRYSLLLRNSTTLFIYKSAIASVAPLRSGGSTLPQ